MRRDNLIRRRYISKSICVEDGILYASDEASGDQEEDCIYASLISNGYTGRY